MIDILLPAPSRKRPTKSGTLLTKVTQTKTSRKACIHYI
jgi:hypothetical protein